MKLKGMIKKLTNETVTVELKTGVSIQGKLVEIDRNMNIYLKNVKRTSGKEKSVLLSEISVRGSSIRYIILPIWLNVETLLSHQLIK